MISSGNVLDHREIFQRRIIDDVIDDEDIGGGQIVLQCGMNILCGGTDDLDLTFAEPLDFFDQKYIGRLAHGDRQGIVNLKQRQDNMFFEEISRAVVQQCWDRRVWADIGAYGTP